MIFNRPETTKRVLNAIRPSHPPLLLVVADGPRPNVAADADRCAAARAVIEEVDWNCEVLKNYAETNLGCGCRISSGLDWAFSLVEEAIILEDDTLPHPTFFRFCDELLERYRHDERIASITGANFQRGQKHSEFSYYYSRHIHVWGWASWRRAWQNYDFQMKSWPVVKEQGLLANILMDRHAVSRWVNILQNVYEGRVDTWDIQWTFACWLQHQLSIIPAVNMVSNIGFGVESTHTTTTTSALANMHFQEMSFPLRHPPFMIQDVKADLYTHKAVYQATFYHGLRRSLKTWLGSRPFK